MSTAGGWEWRYLRGALLGLAVLVLGSLAYDAVHEGTPPLELTTRCLRNEKQLELTPETDPIASTADRGWLATRVEGNGVHVAIAGSESQARRIAELYESISGGLAGRLERRGKVVYLWEGVSTPTQRQTMYDCHYD